MERKKLVDLAGIVSQSDVEISNWLRTLIGTNIRLGEVNNMDTIVDTVNQLAPTINWAHVMEDESFDIPGDLAMTLKMSISSRVCICKEPFPDAVCQSLWKNTEGQNCLARFIDMCHNLQILYDVLDSTPLSFIVTLAAAASRKDHKLIENWLSAKSDQYKSLFLKACINFLDEIMSSTHMEEPPAKVMSIYWGSFPLFLEVCQSQSRDLLPNQLLDEHSTARFGTLPNELEEQVRAMTLKYLLHSNSLDIVDNHIAMLLEDQKFSKKRITDEKENVLMLKGQSLKYHFDIWEKKYLEAEHGPNIDRLKTLTKSNDGALKYLRKVLLNCFDGDALSSQVDDLLHRNKAASKRAGLLISEYHDYRSRAEIEVSWLDEATQKVDTVFALLSRRATVMTQLEKLECDICNLHRQVFGFKKNIKKKNRKPSKRVALVSEERTQNFHSHCQDLDTMAALYEEIGVLSKKLLLVTIDAEKLCLTSKNLTSLVREKTENAARFLKTEQHLKEEKASSKIRQELLEIELEVQQARKSCKEKMAGLPKVSDADTIYERMLEENSMSWRTRLLDKRNILGEMRKQGLDMCAFVSTVVMRESLGKREDARCRIFRGEQYRPEEHAIKLSEYHLQDIFRAFCERNQRKGREKLDVCMERMIERGVVSERDYNGKSDYNGEGVGFTRYRISEFEKMKPGNLVEAYQKLEDAIVLVGTFGITKGYFSLKPGDIYDVPKDAVLETSPSGNNITHAVVIVGYGMSDGGDMPFYAYQNWNGPEWGKGGFGMVSCRSIRQLYSAKL